MQVGMSMRSIALDAATRLFAGPISTPTRRFARFFIREIDTVIKR